MLGNLVDSIGRADGINDARGVVLAWVDLIINNCWKSGNV